MGEEQGALFWLLGSESESLSNGRAAFDEVLAKRFEDAQHKAGDSAGADASRNRAASLRSARR